MKRSKALVFSVLVILLGAFLLPSIPDLPKIAREVHASGPSFYQGRQASVSTTGTVSTNSTKPLQLGDLLIAAGGVLTTQHIGTISDSAGNTWTNASKLQCSNCAFSGGAGRVQIWYATVVHGVGSNDTFSMTGVASDLAYLTFYEFTGFASFAFSSQRTNSTTGSTTQCWVAPYSVPANSINISNCMLGNAPTTATSGFNFVTNSSNSYNIMPVYGITPPSPTVAGINANIAGTFGIVNAVFTTSNQISKTIVGKLLSVGGSPETATITGACSPSPSTMTFSLAGTSNAIMVIPSVACAVIVQSDLTNSRFRGNGSWTGGTIYNFTSTSSGITLYNWQELRNNYSMTPQTPIHWDAGYSKPATGTVLGVASTTICTVTLTNGAGAARCAGWADNDSAASLPSFFNSAVIGIWTGTPPTSFTDLTGGNLRNVNYKLSNVTSNVVTVNWILGPMNTSVTIILVKQNTGTSVGAGNPIQASYFLNSNSTVNLVTGTNTFMVDKNTIVTVAGCSLFSNTTIRWCLAGAIPFSFNASTGATETLGYWIQNNVSWRWVPPTACQNCGLQRPTVGFNSFGVLVPAFQLAAHGTGTNATNYAAAFMDNDTAWSTPNPFNYNLQPWVPNATSPVTVLAPKAFTITYSAGAGCVTSGDPFTAFICSDYVLGFFGVYGNDISTGWFLALILMAFDAYVWLKSNNPGLTLTVLFIEFSFFAVAGAGVGGSATNFLSSSVWQIALIFLTLFLSGSVYRLFVGRRDGG